MIHHVDVSEVDIGKLSSRSETIEESTVEEVDTSDSVVKDRTSPRIADHTSPTSPCSADDNGEQKLSTPGAASSGYGSAVLTQTTSSDDLLGDHTGNDDVIGDRGNNPNSMVVTAEVNIIDAAVPSDLDSPLKPTTPYTDEPTTIPPTSNDISILDYSASDNDVVAGREPEFHESSLECSEVSSGAISNHQISAKIDSEGDGAPESRVSDLGKHVSDIMGDGDNKNNTDNSATESLGDDSHVAKSATSLPSAINHHTSPDDAGIDDDDAGDTDSLPNLQSADRSSVTVRSSSGSVKASYRPISMPPEMTIIEDERMDITTLGMDSDTVIQ